MNPDGEDCRVDVGQLLLADYTLSWGFTYPSDLTLSSIEPAANMQSDGPQARTVGVIKAIRCMLTVSPRAELTCSSYSASSSAEAGRRIARLNDGEFSPLLPSLPDQLTFFVPRCELGQLAFFTLCPTQQTRPVEC